MTVMLAQVVLENRMAGVPEQMIWKSDLWTGKFVNRDYCRFTYDR